MSSVNEKTCATQLGVCDPAWFAIREEAAQIAANEPLLEKAYKAAWRNLRLRRKPV
jgi:hypothetical protein